MTDEQPRRGSSWAVQGCLFGAVALFAILLAVMIFLAYARFREHTADPEEAANAVITTDGATGSNPPMESVALLP